MKVRDIMTSDPVVLRPEMSVREAAALFAERSIDGAPVVDQEGRMQGLFTKTHILRVVGARGDLDAPIVELMQREVTAARPDQDLDEALDPSLGRIPVVDEGGRAVGMITRTDLAKAFFDRFRNVSIEMDTLVNSTHNLIVCVDEHGRINLFNKQAEKFLEARAEDVIGKPVNDVFPTSGLAEVARTGKVEPVQKIMLNNRYFISNRSPIIKDGKIRGAVAVLQDISELEKISQELKYVKELNEELDAIIESSFDGLYVVDGQGVTLRLNKAFERITGVNASEFLGRNVSDIEAEGIVSESVSSLVLKRKEPVTIIQETKSGKTTLATGSPVMDKNGNIFRVVCNVRDITELNLLKQELEQARSLTQHYETQLRTLQTQYVGSHRLVVNSPKMRDLLAMVVRLAQVDSTILITGESGTGKELIAETIHHNSTRKGEPFIKVNCGAIPENLLESELFGYDYGAFTGARKEGKPGYFELAHGGTLFLDEVGELPLALQVKLLRVLQNKEVQRVGGARPIEVDVRIVAGTNRNLMDMVQRKEFREDLYYRLNVVPVNVPPLRERKEEIPSLVAHFLQAFNSKYKLNKSISQEVIDIFMDYEWPGNVRELENLIERLVVITPKDLLGREDLPAYLTATRAARAVEISVSGIIPLKDAVETVERQILERAYAKHRTTRQMAKELRVNASTIVRKAAKYGITAVLEEH